MPYQYKRYSEDQIRVLTSQLMDAILPIIDGVSISLVNSALDILKDLVHANCNIKLPGPDEK